MVKRKTRVRKNVSLTAITNCQNKKWYKTEAQALAASEDRMFDNMTASIGTYKCNICGNWHLTSLVLL